MIGAAALLAFVVVFQMGAVALGNQCTLSQGGPPQFRAAFSDTARVFGFIGVTDAGHDAEVGRQLAFIGEVADIIDDRQQDAGAESTDPLNRGEILVPFQLQAFPADRLLQLGNGLVQGLDLLDENLHLQIYQQVDLCFQRGFQPLFTGQRFLVEMDPVRENMLLILFFSAVRNFTIVSRVWSRWRSAHAFYLSCTPTCSPDSYLYSKDATAGHVFLREVLGFSSVNAGQEWLIFALPPAV